MNKLVNVMIHKGHLKSDLIIDAFAEVPRVEFMTKRFRSASEADIPIPLGFGQIMPTPSTIATMIELLRPQRGQRILVAGLASGWVSALLCYIVGKEGHVTSCAINASIEKMARTNVAKFSFIEKDHIIDLYTATSCEEIDASTPFDRILVLNEVYAECSLENLLTKEGVLVSPRDNVIHCYTKKLGGEIDLGVFPEMNFLPSS